MQNETFRKYVGTKKHVGKVTQPDGSPRSITWTNTNELLKKEGYDGVKTGTTKSAGCCLVSSCRRDDDHLICVVLGATSDKARWADTESLMKWAWAARGHKK